MTSRSKCWTVGDDIMMTEVSMGAIVWFPLTGPHAKRPEDKKVYLVTGPSGYTTRDMTRFVMHARIDEEYRPSRGGPLRWLDHGSDALTDGGLVPTHFAEPFALPGEPE